MTTFWNRLLATDDGWAPLLLRLALGIVMFPHGAQKMLGWWGGSGFSGTMGFMTEKMGLPTLIVFLVIMIEFFGSLALIAGVMTRLAALGIGVEMLGAVATVHASNGFFMNWTGQQAGEGFEYHILVLGIVAALVILGAGRWSLDRALSRG